MAGFFVTALLKVNDGVDVDYAKKEIAALCEETRKEEGCYRFDVLFDQKDPTRFFLWEEFENKAALDLHFELPHTKEYLSKNITQIEQVFYCSEISFNRG